MAYLYLFLAVSFNIGANILFKIISGRANSFGTILLFGLGLGLGAVNAFFLTKSLKTINLNVAYPVFSACCIAAMMLISIIMFREKLALINIAGVILIVAGIGLVTQ